MKRLFYKLSLAIGLLALPCLLFAQRTISGTITDAADGLPLIGANILVVGAEGVGTVTDIDGSYSINVPPEGTALLFSYTGYASKEIPLGASNVIDLAMAVGSVLNEVVVIGYGEIKREDATGSVTAVGEESFNKGAITSAQDLLAGKVAGVQIVTSSDPGGGSQIRIRGGSSLSASNDPLIVIDGVPVFNNGISGSRNVFNFVNPNDIETITVLKDASATAIYGSRASNGVIIITTKEGNLGKLTVNYNGSVNISQVQQTVDVMNATEYRNLITERTQAGFEEPGTDTLLGSANTDWQDEIYQSAFGQDHSLNFSGGLGDLPYRASIGYTNMDGILKNDQFTRTTAALNLTPKFFDSYLQVNANVRYAREENQFGNRAAIGAAASMDPTQPILDPENTRFGGYYTWLNNSGLPDNLAPANPIALLEQREDESSVDRYVANAVIDYRFHFLPELRANLNVAYDYGEGSGTVKVDTFAAFNYNSENGGGIDNRYKLEITNQLFEAYLNYVKEIGDSKFDLMGGYSYQSLLIEDDFRNANFVNTENLIETDTNANELFLASLYGRFNYTFQGKYLFTFTMRRDGTSRFSDDARWGLFPAAAFAWKAIDNEGGKFSSLKFRLGWGITGQQDVGGFYDYLPRYLVGQPNARYQFGNEFVTTIRPDGYDNNLKWEETTTYNFGIDYGFLKNRLIGAIEFYRRETKDLLNFIPVPAGSNLTNFINTNVGDLENTGVEFSIDAKVIDNADLTWNFGANVSYNRNEITKLTATEDPNYVGVLTGGIAGAVGNTIQIHSVGYPVRSFYVYEQVYDDNGKPIEGLYVDQNNDGIINNEDLYRHEDPAPDVYMGFTSNLTYKNWDFSFAARANIGNYAYNNIEYIGSSYDRMVTTNNSLLNVHRNLNDLQFQETNEQFSDYFIQNASFFRFDHFTLGYDFSDKIDGVSWLKLFSTIQNPILITKYDGIDPELNDGIDNNIYPRSRRIIFGINARF